ncbi:MAG: hypothetical protein CHACPFDD_00255 [Phycisphaerae bacterium]|nr:hypothetical protein [Phycisphaerae bacterium]
MSSAPFEQFDDLWDFTQPAATEQKLRALLPAARASGRAALLAQLLTQIARTEGLQRRFDQARQTLDEAEGLLSAEHVSVGAAPPPPRCVDSADVAGVRLLLERGRVHNSSGQPDAARPLFAEALELARSLSQDFYAVDAAHMLGIVDQGEASLRWNEQAIRMAEASPDPKANNWLGSLYNNTGWTCHDMGRFAEALAWHEKNLAWQLAHQKESQAAIARWCIARTLRSLGRVDDALQRQNALLAEHAQRGTSDGFVHEEIAECLLVLARESEARPHFAAAHAALSQDPWLVANESPRLERLKRLADSR